MKKATAIALLGGTIRAAALNLGVSTQAVSKWPEEGRMPRVVCDRVLAHHVREACKRDSSLLKLLHLPLDALLLKPTRTPAKPPRSASPMAAMVAPTHSG